MHSAVSWESAVNLGPLPGVEWVCPGSDTAQLKALKRSGETIVPDDVVLLADGRWRHMELWQYPEGYHALQIIDTETGRQVDAERENFDYFSLPLDGTTKTKEFFVDIGDGREIDRFQYMNGYVETNIRPTQVLPSELDHSVRCRNYTQVNPGKQGLSMDIYGEVEAVPGMRIWVRLQEWKGKIQEANVSLFSIVRAEAQDRLEINLNSSGGVERVSIDNAPSLLCILGTTIEKVPTVDGEVTESKVRDLLLELAAEAMGFERWGNLDLKLTASGLYSILGQRNIDPSSKLLFQD